MSTSGPSFAVLERDGWTLADVAQRYRERNGIYWLAPEEARRDLQPGNLVKLLFQWAVPAPDGLSGERMWVRVALAQGGAFHAHLANIPFHPTPPITEDAGLWFRPEHVIDVQQEEDAKLLSELSELVRCKGHGPSECCYVCEHLCDGEGLGFFTSDSDRLRPDAWCGACERLLEGKSGWDEVEPHPRIRLVCGGCYDGMRERNAGPER